METEAWEALIILSLVTSQDSPNVSRSRTQSRFQNSCCFVIDSSGHSGVENQYRGSLNRHSVIFVEADYYSSSQDEREHTRSILLNITIAGI